MKAETMLGFRIVRKGAVDSPDASYSCERIAGGRVVNVSPAQEREFMMFEMLDKAVSRQDVPPIPKTVKRTEDGDLEVVPRGEDGGNG